MTDLGKFFKTPAERKRYSVDYADWLDTDEEVSSAEFTVTPSGELEIDAYSISDSGGELIFFANAGEDQAEYVVTVKVTTSGGQVKEDQILFEVQSL